MRRTAFISIAVTGFATGIGQIVVLRELLILFYGNELSTGLVLTAWLVWTAVGSSIGGGIAHRFPLRPAVHGLGLLLLACLLPATLLWLRSARLLWSIPLGELVGPGLMIAVSLTTTGAFCTVSGCMFAWCWHVYVCASPEEPRVPQPIMIYLGEALGAAAGGLFFYFVLLPYGSNFTAICVTAVATSGLVLLFVRPWRESTGRRPLTAIIALTMGLATAVAAVNSDRLDELSHRWQWGAGLVAVQDTPYNNLALLQEANQYTLFTSGLWFFSVPDPKTAEFAVHLAMLQHPRPQKVLLVGGGSVELIGELLKYSSLARLDVVDPDPGMVGLLYEYLPEKFMRPVKDRRVHLHHEDAVAFMGDSRRSYDVILLNLGDPMNAERNRFYTLEFFQKLGRRLSPGGLLSFDVSASDFLGPVQVRFLRSLYDTLQAVFPDVTVYLLDSARFFSTRQQGLLVSDARELLRRMAERGLHLRHLQESYLLDYLNPMRLNYLASILAQSLPQSLNRDFSPTCYFNNLLLWAFQLHPGLEQVLIGLSSVPRRWLWIVLAAALAVLAVFSWRGVLGCETTCQVSVMIMGAAQLILEILLLLSFQVMQGFVYRQLSLIVTLYMAGAACGALLDSLLAVRIRRAVLWLAGVQIIFALYVLGVLKILFVMHDGSGGLVGGVSASVIFAILAMAAGVLGGVHFALGIRVIAGFGSASAALAGHLYGVDLIGAASGAVVASLFLVPVYGVVTTMSVLAVASAGAATALLTMQSSSVH